MSVVWGGGSTTRLAERVVLAAILGLAIGAVAAYATTVSSVAAQIAKLLQ